jgi:hypothetical protein
MSVENSRKLVLRLLLVLDFQSSAIGISRGCGGRANGNVIKLGQCDSGYSCFLGQHKGGTLWKPDRTKRIPLPRSDFLSGITASFCCFRHWRRHCFDRMCLLECSSFPFRSSPARSNFARHSAAVYGCKCHCHFGSVLSASTQAGNILYQFRDRRCRRDCMHVHLWTVLRCPRNCVELLSSQLRRAGLGDLQISKIPEALACAVGSARPWLDAQHSSNGSATIPFSNPRALCIASCSLADSATQRFQL